MWSFFSSYPLVFIAAVAIIAVVVFCIAYLLAKRKGSVSVGKLSFDFNDKESVKETTSKDTEQKQAEELRKRWEDYIRHTLAKQFDQVTPFMHSLRPVFNRLVFSILDDAVAESLGIRREERKFVKKEPADKVSGGYYEVEEVTTYHSEPRTRIFSSLVESTVDSLMGSLEREVYNMLISNHIGKTSDEVKSYINMKSENIIGTVRNCLCDAYNNLSNNNLFDTHKYWSEAGIEYPEDWIQDKIYRLFVLCMQVRYKDFVS